MVILRGARRGACVLSAALLASVGLVACSSTGSGASGDAIRVGVTTSLTGSFGTYGNMIKDGLEAGLYCSTDGTNEVDGKPIEFVYADDGGDPEQTLAAATRMVGDGINILTGTTSSAAALQLGHFAEQQNLLYISGAAGIDDVTGLNANTFRASRQAYQEAAALSSVLEKNNNKTVVLAQDYAFGQKYASTITGILESSGSEVEEVLVPLDTNEFTPYARRISELKPDLLIVVYYGDGAPSMWQAMSQQGILDTTTVASVLVEKPHWSIYGDAAEKINFVTHYYPGAPGGEMNECLTERVPDADLSTHDGFVAAQQIVHAISTAGPDDVEGMIEALEGWSFEAPKGPMTIRSGDHALLQDMYIVSLSDSDGELAAHTVGNVGSEAAKP
ncbi:substrate-binding domain-containing protein [Rhodococcus sp. NPDC059968]|uniref:substrate-binding domain-containing protein n=1 Tax=Rhodococcus sp. NPDC059968 TaxID=3347017 RepID=UPI00366E84D3